MDRLHSMRVFARVVDEGSFAGAARKLDLSAAVATRAVARHPCSATASRSGTPPSDD